MKAEARSSCTSCSRRLDRARPIEERPISRWNGARKRGVQNRYQGDDDRYCEPRRRLERLVRYGEGQWRQPSGQRFVGRRVGLVLVRRWQPDKDNIDRLQTELQILPRAGADDRLGLRRRIPCIEAIEGTLRGDQTYPLSQTQPKEFQMAKEATMKDMSMAKGKPGHVYIQTNEIENAIIHYERSATGALTEVERIGTRGAGSGEFKPISGQESAPNAFEGAGSIIFSPDRRFLFTTNGGDNSVSSFGVSEDGRLTLLDVKPTGNPAERKNPTSTPLPFAPLTLTLFLLPSSRPYHLR